MDNVLAICCPHCNTEIWGKRVCECGTCWILGDTYGLTDIQACEYELEDIEEFVRALGEDDE